MSASAVRLLLFVLFAGVLVAWLVRERGTRDPESADEPAATQNAAPPTELRHGGASSARVESGPREPAPEPDGASARIRVADAATGETLPDCSVELRWRADGATHTEFGAAQPDGTRAFRGDAPEGSEVHVELPLGWEPVEERVDTPAPPWSELVFLARAVPLGPLHGTIVDVESSEPCPYFDVTVDGEELLSDANGRFASARMHQRGTLKYSAAFGSWTYEGWDPTRDEPLRLWVDGSGRVFVTLDRRPEECTAIWTAEPMPLDFRAWSFDLVERSEGEVRFDPDRVQLKGAPTVLDHGTLVVVSEAEYLVALEQVSPGLGTLAHPLPLTFAPCGVLEIETEPSRDLADEERLVLTVRDEEGGALQQLAFRSWSPTFLLRRAGEYTLDVSFEGSVVATKIVTAQLMETTTASIRIELPSAIAESDTLTPPSSGPTMVTYSVHVRSRTGKSYPTRVLLCSNRADQWGSDTSVEWTKTAGHWDGRARDTALEGRYQVRLAAQPPFDWVGPRTVEIPRDTELDFTIEDDVPVIDVYFDPIAAEDGSSLSAFSAECYFASTGSTAYFGHPATPVLKAHPRSIPFDWTCTAPGRRTVLGSYRPGDDVGESVRLPPVKLAIGSSRVLMAQAWGGELSGGGLPGVRVASGGVFLGVTSATGLLCFDYEVVEPLSFAVLGWELAQLGYTTIAPDGSFGLDDEFLYVELVPATK